MVQNMLQALKAIHELQIEAKIFALDNTRTNEFFYYYFDEIEHLTGLMVDDKDYSTEFHNYLMEICKKYSLRRAWMHYIEFNK